MLNKSRNSWDIFIILVIEAGRNKLIESNNLKAKSVGFIKEIYKRFKIDSVAWFQTRDLYHCCRKLQLTKLTR
jgi:hypothetical protein